MTTCRESTGRWLGYLTGQLGLDGTEGMILILIYFDDEDAYDGTEGLFLKLEVGPSTDSNKGGLRSQIWMIFWKTQESQSQM